ncbi:MAG: S24 family peptidase [Gammaproteobacteria bacterium]|nr:S24 family peptidase [Gammaproteobacteria bacterium]
MRVTIEPSIASYAHVLGIDSMTLENADVAQCSELEGDYPSHLMPQFLASATPASGVGSMNKLKMFPQLSVNQFWLENNFGTVSSLDNLSIITASDDSMHDSFAEGDSVLVDVGIDTVDKDGIYVLELNHALYIKRLQRRPDGSMMMLSDNAKYPPYVITEHDELQVLGRIVGSWNFKRL